MWNDGPAFEHHLTDPWAPHPVVNRHVCNGDGGGKGDKGPMALAFPLLGPLAAAGAGLAGVGELADAGLGAADAFGATGSSAAALGSAAAGGVGAGLDALGGPASGAGGAFDALGATGDVASGLGGSGLSDIGGLGGDVTTGTGGLAAGTGTATDVGGGGLTAGASSPAAGVSPSALTNPFEVSGTSGVPGLGSTSAPGFGTASGESTAFSDTFGDAAASGTGTTGATAGSGWPAGELTQPGVDPSAWGGAAITPPSGPTPLDPSVFPSTSSIDAGISGTGGGASPVWFSQISNFLGANKNLINLGLGGTNLVRGLTKPSIDTGALTQAQLDAYNRLKQLSDTLTANGGQLTPQQAQQFANDLAAVQSAIKSNYAGKGMAPNSTAVQEDLAAAEAANTAGQANTMSANLRTGLSASGMSTTDANSLITYQLAQDQQLSQMIARLAQAGLSLNPTS